MSRHFDNRAAGASLVAIAIGLAGCAASEPHPDEPESTATPTATPAAEPEPDLSAGGETERAETGAEEEIAPGIEPELGDGTPYEPDPKLTMYVQGPWPVQGRSGRVSPTGEYEADIVVVNEGEEPAEVRQAAIWFEASKDGDAQRRCRPAREAEGLDGPAVIEPGEAHTYTARVRCELGEPGEYEIRAFMHFGADDLDADSQGADDAEVERHYVGTYELRVPRSAGSSEG